VRWSTLEIISLNNLPKIYKNNLNYTNPRPFVARLRPSAL